MKSRDERIKKLSEDDLTVAEIAEAVGLSKRQVGRIRKRLGLVEDNPPLTAEQRAEIKRLSEEETWPPEEIAATLGLSADAVSRWCTPGVGKDWSATASILSRKYPRLFRELRSPA